MALKQVEITGKVTFNFRQWQWVPEDEVADLLADEASLICNVDMDEVTNGGEGAVWEDVEGRVLR